MLCYEEENARKIRECLNISYPRDPPAWRASAIELVSTACLQVSVNQTRPRLLIFFEFDRSPSSRSSVRIKLLPVTLANPKPPRGLWPGKVRPSRADHQDDVATLPFVRQEFSLPTLTLSLVSLLVQADESRCFPFLKLTRLNSPSPSILSKTPSSSHPPPSLAPSSLSRPICLTLTYLCLQTQPLLDRSLTKCAHVIANASLTCNKKRKYTMKILQRF